MILFNSFELMDCRGVGVIMNEEDLPLAVIYILYVSYNIKK